MKDCCTFKSLILLLSAAYLMSNALHAYSLDHVKLPKRKERNELQQNYLMTVLETALKATEDEYGPYKISADFPGVLRERAAKEVASGKRINALVSTLKTAYLGNVLIVPFPIRRGILSYRLALVHKDNRNIFTQLDSSEQLKGYKVGLFSDLSTLSMMDEMGFSTVPTPSHHTMFSMLQHKRFQYTLRGVHEAADELDRLRNIAPHVEIEKTRVFSMFLPTLIFLSPNEPRLAERIEKGLLKIYESGEFIALFNKFYSDPIVQSNLRDRKIIKIDSPLESIVDFPDLPDLWFDPEKEIPAMLEQ